MQTLVFDFDGTLATCPYDFHHMRQSVLRVAVEFGLDPDHLGDDSGLLETIAFGEQLLADHPARAAAFRAAAMESLCALEYDAAAHTVLLPGIVDALHALRSAQYRLGIITRNSAAAVARIIGETALPVEHILSREAVTRPKPHPEHVQKMLALLGSEADSALMVGDHPMDVATGKAAGMGTVAVLTGQSSEHELRQAAPDWLFPSVVDLVAALL